MGSSALKVVRRDESLKSIQQKGIHMRLLYENEWLEILATEVEPENSVTSSELCDSAAVHFVMEGGLLFHDLDSSILLLSGDSITLREGEHYRIFNPTSSRSTIWSLLLKRSEYEKAEQERKEGGL